ncbi:fatty-acyl-CoA synthase [Alkalispirochaeta americana]|uniref:Fatty-acyl-CoA synthase n=1 Tax=Alkalispirochaeta americana TaxID=159291 RepID=A0A1N6SYF8_9SPIO|nr:AMP-binding protein [Alkalispirochaeta americana]SIQ46017.1 fatty-acyl-CoA synthase [Alkalispirochaeta americana]
MIPLENIHLGEYISRATQRFSSLCAVHCGGRSWSYADLGARSDLIASGLLSRGVRPGDHVGILAEDQPETLFFFCAVMKIGAVAVMLCTSLQSKELKDLLVFSDVKYLALGEGYKDIDFISLFEEIGPLPALDEVFYLGRDPGKLPSMVSLNRLIEAGQAGLSGNPALRDHVEIDPESTATILFTSGTSSRPKAVKSSHFSRVNNAIQQAHDMRLSSSDRICVALPMFHCFSLSVNILAAFSVGASLHFPPNRRTLTILETLQRGQCTVLHAVPTLFNALISRRDFNDFDLSSLRLGLIGGALYSPELFVMIEEKMGMTLLSSLGQTECTAGLTICDPDDPLELRAATVGRFMDHVEGKIIDPVTGLEVAPGESGEIVVRGYLAMQGYYKQPEATKHVLDSDGWVHTGDCGYMNEEGYLCLTGRLKDLIIRGGENISPAELEGVIRQDPRVADVKVIGVPDDHYGEEIAACLVVREGQVPEADEVRRLVRSRLASFKVPRFVFYFDDFPKTPVGKVRTGELRRYILAQFLSVAGTK